MSEPEAERSVSEPEAERPAAAEGGGHRVGAAAAEPVDVIDPHDGRVVGRATRAEVRAGNLWHRSVFVVVVTSADEVVVHQRAAWKDVWPSRWDVCFGGVVGAGESWEQAAVRELAEEAGVVVDPAALVALGEGRYESERVREVARGFLLRSDGPFAFVDGEVARAERVPRRSLARWCRSHDLVPDSEQLVVPLLFAGSPSAVTDDDG